MKNIQSCTNKLSVLKQVTISNQKKMLQKISQQQTEISKIKNENKMKKSVLEESSLKCEVLKRKTEMYKSAMEEYFKFLQQPHISSGDQIDEGEEYEDYDQSSVVYQKKQAKNDNPSYKRYIENPSMPISNPKTVKKKFNKKFKETLQMQGMVNNSCDQGMPLKMNFIIGLQSDLKDNNQSADGSENLYTYKDAKLDSIEPSFKKRQFVFDKE